ncbi:MAG: FtsX-like permease family protein [Actinomycetaceae bacterium]|nr:FtsX-like permease family protein [Actinomycetaceae bacterium]
MWKVTIRSLRTGFARYVMTLLAVALGVAFLATTLTLRSSLGEQFLQLSQSSTVYDIYVVGAQSGQDGNTSDESSKDSDDSNKKNSSDNGSSGLTLRSQLPDSLKDDLENVIGAVEVLPQYAINVQLRDSQGQTIIKNANAPVLVVSQPHERQIRQSRIIGKIPEGKDEVVIEKGGLKAAHLKVGDKAQIWRGTEKMPVTIVGKMDLGHSMAGATIMFMASDAVRDMQMASKLELSEENIRQALQQSEEIKQLPQPLRQETIDNAVKEQLKDISEKPLQVPSIAIRVNKNSDVHVTKERLERKLRNVWKNYELTTQPDVLTRQEKIDEDNRQIEESLGYVNIFLLVFVGIALFVGIFIIANTFRMIVQAQQKQFAMLRAIGVSAQQIFLVVFFQGLIIGVMGSALGIALSLGLNKILKAIISSSGLLIDDLELTSEAISVAIIVGVLVTLLGAIIPARIAAKTPPVEAMRVTEGAQQKSLLVPTIIGIIMMLAGSLGIILAAGLYSDHPGLLLGGGIVIFLLGLLIATPALSRPIVWLVAWPLRIMRPTGKLAMYNVLRNPRRTAATASALMIGVTLMTLGSVMAASMKEASSDIVDSQVLSPIIVSSPTNRPIPATLAKEIRQVEGVKHASNDLNSGVLDTKYPQVKKDSDGNVIDQKRSLDHSTYESTFVVEIDPKSIDRDFIIPVKEGSLDPFIHQTSKHPSVLVNEIGWSQDHPMPGDIVKLKGEKKTVEATVSAVVNSQVVKSPYILSLTTARDIGVSNEVHFVVMVTVKDGANIAKVCDAIQKKLDDVSGMHVAMTKDDYKDKLSEQVDTMLGIIYALLALSIIIAILGIINTQSLSISERVREIGLLRAIGYGRTKIAGMVVAESVLVAVFGSLLGFLSGTFVSWGLLSYLKEKDLGISVFVFPSTAILVMVFASIAVGILSGIVPSIRAGRIRLLSAISYNE